MLNIDMKSVLALLVVLVEGGLTVSEALDEVAAAVATAIDLEAAASAIDPRLEPVGALVEERAWDRTAVRALLGLLLGAYMRLRAVRMQDHTGYPADVVARTLDLADAAEREARLQAGLIGARHGVRADVEE